MQNATSFSLYRHVETQLWILLDQTGCRKWWNNAVSLKVWKILSRLNFRRTNVIHGNEQKVNRFCSTENAILSPQMFKFWNKTISVESNYLKEIYIHFKQLTVCYISCAQKTVVFFFFRRCALSYACYSQQVTSQTKVALTWPEPIYIRVGYVFDLRFSEWKIQPISMIFGILSIDNNGTLRKMLFIFL